MSIATEIQTLQANKAAIKAAIEAKNPAVAPTDNMSNWPASIASITPPVYDAEVEYVQWPAASKPWFYVDLPGGSYPGFGCHVKGMVVASGNNLSILGNPSGFIFTNWLVNDGISGQRTGVNRNAAVNKPLEWYVHRDGVNGVSWVKENGVIVGTTYEGPATDLTSDISSFRLVAATNNNNNTQAGRMYFVKIYNYDTLVHDVIPVRIKSFGFMYDRVTSQLLSSGSLTFFKVGPDVTA